MIFMKIFIVFTLF